MDLSALIPAHRALHNNFLTSVRALQRDLVRTAYFLLQIRERCVYRALGFRRISDYAAAVAGLNSRQCRDFLFLAKRLPRFPEVAVALREGRMSWSQARLICARSEPEEQQHWVDAARGMSVRGMAKALESSHGPNKEKEQCPKPNLKNDDRSPDPSLTELVENAPRRTPLPSPKEEPRRCPIPAGKEHFITLKMDGEQYARWERLGEAARRRGPLVEALLAGLAGTGKGTMDSIHIVILECPQWGVAVMPTSRGEVQVERPQLKAGHCDAVIEDAQGNRRRTVPPKVRRLALQRARYRCEAAGCGKASFLQIHHRKPVSGAGGNHLENLIVLCWRCHQTLHKKEAEARQALRNAPG